MLSVVLWTNQVHSVKDLVGLVKNKTKDGLSDSFVICNKKIPNKTTSYKIKWRAREDSNL